LVNEVTCIVLALAVLAGARLEDSTPPRTELAAVLELDWDAPQVCPSASEVMGLVQEHIDPRAELRPVHLRGIVTSGGAAAWTLELELHVGDHDDRRQLHAVDCATLARAVGLIAAIALDPLGSRERSSERDDALEPAEVRIPSVPPEPVADDLPSSAEVADPVTRITAPWELRIGAGPAWAERPRPHALLRLAAGWSRRAFGVRFGTDVWLPARFSEFPPEDRALGWQVGRVLAHLGACWAPGNDRVRAPLCAGATAGLVYGRQYGAETAETVLFPSAAAFASVGVRGIPVAGRPNIGLFVDFEPAVQITRPRIRSGDWPGGFRGARASISAVAGLVARFGGSRGWRSRRRDHRDHKMAVIRP
jgi:hypothetical protein